MMVTFETIPNLGRGGGQVVSKLASSSEDPSPTPTVISVKFLFEKYENKPKRDRGWPILTKQKETGVGRNTFFG